MLLAWAAGFLCLRVSWSAAIPLRAHYWIRITGKAFLLLGPPSVWLTASRWAGPTHVCHRIVCGNSERVPKFRCNHPAGWLHKSERCCGCVDLLHSLTNHAFVCVLPPPSVWSEPWNFHSPSFTSGTSWACHSWRRERWAHFSLDIQSPRPSSLRLLPLLHVCTQHRDDGGNSRQRLHFDCCSSVCTCVHVCARHWSGRSMEISRNSRLPRRTGERLSVVRSASI